MSEIRLQKIEYYRAVKPPTLKQFLLRKAVSEISKEIKGTVGVLTEQGRLMPNSAKAFKDKLAGLTAERIAELHPEWAKEYEGIHGQR